MPMGGMGGFVMLPSSQVIPHALLMQFLASTRDGSDGGDEDDEDDEDDEGDEDGEDGGGNDGDGDSAPQSSSRCAHQ